MMAMTTRMQTVDNDHDDVGHDHNQGKEGEDRDESAGRRRQQRQHGRRAQSYMAATMSTTWARATGVRDDDDDQLCQTIFPCVRIMFTAA